jgi:hypothetical protein
VRHALIGIEIGIVRLDLGFEKNFDALAAGHDASPRHGYSAAPLSASSSAR